MSALIAKRKRAQAQIDPTQPERDAKSLSERLLEVNKRASALLGGRPSGDEHFPGEVNLERLNLKKDLPRRG
jgi:hypothetical protein